MSHGYRLSITVPTTHLNQVKEAIFAAGAGRYGNYSHCSWETLGRGQFKPLAGANPFIGKENQVEQVEEYLVETFCEESELNNVLKALQEAHPYEEPGFFVTQLQ